MEERLRLAPGDTLLDPKYADLLRYRLEDDPLAPLIRLFLLHDAVEADLLPDWLENEELSVILERDGHEVRALTALQPWRDFLVAHDWTRPDMAQDHVVGVSEVSTLLANMTVRRKVGRALDLCSASGVQALLAARHASSVVATDLSSRAIELACWTLALNDEDRIELRQGDLLTPVEGERFDLIVSVPPYVVSPDSTYHYRDAGDSPTPICKTIVRHAPAFLAEGGYAQALCSWPLRAGEAWDDAPRAWVEDCGCDAWILRLPADDDPTDYAIGWNRHLHGADQREFDETVRRWLGWFAAEGIERIATGLVTLRRRHGGWVRSDEAVGMPGVRGGQHVDRVFAGQTLVSSLPDRTALLDRVVVPVETSRLRVTDECSDGRLRPVTASMRYPEGIPVRVALTEATVALLRRLDGRVTLAQALDESTRTERVLEGVSELVSVGLLDVS